MILVSIQSDLHLGIRVLLYLLFADLFAMSTTNEWIFRFLERIKDVSPKPILVPIGSYCRPNWDDMKFEIDFISPGKKDFAYFCTDYSACDRLRVAAANHDVVVSSLETRQRLAWLKGHEKHISIVKFNSDSSNVISGSFDNNVIAWD